jgi:hypothetical protein
MNNIKKRIIRDEKLKLKNEEHWMISHGKRSRIYILGQMTIF